MYQRILSAKNYLIVLLISTALIWVCSGCANIVPPSGGDKDTTAPVLTAMTPADSQLNTKVSRLTLHFNKFVEIHDLEKNLQMSPLLPSMPSILSYGKRVEIKITDSLLKPNTTYTIALGDAIVDNRENTPFPDFKYVFSTGSYFDSLQTLGRVFDAETGMPDTGAVVLLYPLSEGDSAVLKKKPVYISRADKSGYFRITSLPGQPFMMYALEDKSNNNFYDLDEDKIGFLDSNIMPALERDTAQYTLRVFKQPADSTGTDTSAGTTDTANTKGASMRGRRKPGAGNDKSLYKVNVDTANKEIRTQEINAPITIDLHTELSVLDKSKMYLSYDDNGMEVEAVNAIRQDSNKIILQPEQWQQDKIYTLRLVKGWARDTAGNELLPDKYSFHSKRDDDYGLMRVHVPSQYTGRQYLLFVYKETDTISIKPIADSTVTFRLLQPGAYNMRIIEDKNGNGRWDAGNILTRLQPEMVVPFNTTTNVKAGWEHDVDFIPAAYNTSLKDRNSIKNDVAEPPPGR